MQNFWCQDFREEVPDILQRASILLKFPQNATCASLVIYHRIFREKVELNVIDVIASCLFVASKLEETFRRPGDIMKVVNQLWEKHVRKHPPNGWTSDKHVIPRDSREMLELEKMILRESGFRFEFEYPHKFVLNYAKILDLPQTVTQRAWNYVNDSFRHPLCVTTPAHVVAVASIMLSSRYFAYPLPEDPPWWRLFEITDIEELSRICVEILSLYGMTVS